MNRAERVAMVDRSRTDLSVRRQCTLLGLARSGVYHQPAALDPEELALMRWLDEQYLATPFYGSRRMTAELRKAGRPVNRKRVQRLMRLMGLEALGPKPKTTTRPSAQHRVYPYLLRGVTIDRPNQVWAADITYIPMARGFLYLVVVMDWHSRYVLAWRLSNTMDTSFCLDALEDALRKGRPEIFNTDQGAQFTSAAFTDKLEAAGVRISMDGRGRWLDNVFVERLWRSLKYEEVHLKARWHRPVVPFLPREPAAPGFGLRNSGSHVGGRGEPCGFAAALGRRQCVAHNSTGPTTAKRGIHLTRKRSGLHLKNLLLWS
jgi:putative transposase